MADPNTQDRKSNMEKAEGERPDQSQNERPGESRHQERGDSGISNRPIDDDFENDEEDEGQEQVQRDEKKKSDTSAG